MPKNFMSMSYIIVCPFYAVQKKTIDIDGWT